MLWLEEQNKTLIVTQGKRGSERLSEQDFNVNVLKCGKLGKEENKQNNVGKPPTLRHHPNTTRRQRQLLRQQQHHAPVAAVEAPTTQTRATN